MVIIVDGMAVPEGSCVYLLFAELFFFSFSLFVLGNGAEVSLIWLCCCCHGCCMHLLVNKAGLFYVV